MEAWEGMRIWSTPYMMSSSSAGRLTGRSIKGRANPNTVWIMCIDDEIVCRIRFRTKMSVLR
jgi:hypothetical protein